MKTKKAVDLIKGAKGAFPKTSHSKLPEDDILLNLISLNKDDFSMDKLLTSLETDLNTYEKSILLRILIAETMINSVELNTHIDIKQVWNNIYDSLINFTSDDIISSIGSQGFLAIPLFRIEKTNEEFYLLRLHIWSNDLNSLINSENAHHLRIHTHQFHANSWIVCGEVFNTRYSVTEVNDPTLYTLFDIKYNNSDKNAVKNTSVAINSYSFVDVKEQIVEKYKRGEKYEIGADNFHMSAVSEEFDITSTIFLFSSKKSRTKVSKVLGPSNLKESEINRIENINPLPFLNKIDQIIRND